MTEICQLTLPEGLRQMRPLPGIAPLDPALWLDIDDAYAAQMRHRDALLAARAGEVIAVTTGSEGAQDEAMRMVLEALAMRPDFKVKEGEVLCPDGRIVPLDGPPLTIIGRLVQEDVCILQKADGAQEHVLTAAVLCFPASWRLSEKIGRALYAIHAPVAAYDAQLAQRVQRLFDGVQAGRPLWRFNRLWYSDPELFQPRSEIAPREDCDGRERGFLRSERQCILRLPKTRAVVFSIHTYVLRAKTARMLITSDNE